MPTDDWYRRTTWTDEDRIEFNTRLNRARKYNRLQYLRIQAAHLAGVGNYTAALELLDKFLLEDDGSIELAQAQLQCAEALVATGNGAEAINAFRASLQAERDKPNVKTEAWLQFPWFIVESQNVSLYTEAANILNEFTKSRSPSFPVDDYRLQSITAILLEHEGDTAQARVHAQKALAASNKKHSGYRYHPNVGLVSNISSTVHERVSRVAAKDSPG